MCMGGHSIASCYLSSAKVKKNVRLIQLGKSAIMISEADPKDLI